MRSNFPRQLVFGVTLGLLVVTSGCLGAFGGGGSAETPAPTTAPPTATAAATPAPENGSTNATASPMASPTDDGPASPSVSPSPSPSASPTPTPGPGADLNTTTVERLLRERVDARRAEAGYDGLIRTRTGNLTAMARAYSEALVDVGYLTHEAGGETPRERYERYGLRERCRITNDANKGVVPTAELEVLGIVPLGENQTVGGTTYVATNETTVAEVLVAQWYAEAESRRTLMLSEARHLGIGITVEDGTVYAVGEVC